MLGYKASNLIQQRFYDYHHALDAEMIEKAYKTREFAVTLQILMRFRNLTLQRHNFWRDVYCSIYSSVHCLIYTKTAGD